MTLTTKRKTQIIEERVNAMLDRIPERAAAINEDGGLPGDLLLPGPERLDRYWLLTKAMDSHHLARGRGGDVDHVLQQIPQPTLIIGVSSDILCPLDEQRHLAQQMPRATLIEIDSSYGHDGFMVESEKIAKFLSAWME